MYLPESIKKMIADEQYQTDGIGMSQSSVLLFQDKVLKVQECGREAETECRMMDWLRGKLPVPRVLACEKMEDKSYLLMSRCMGEMACEEKYLDNPAKLARLLAAALKRLWEVDISDCPSDWSLREKLALASYHVENGLVDTENVEPDTYGAGGFENPQALLRWLYENKPEEELVLSHGDFCLPNILFDVEGEASYIDLGKMGIADKWCDIAICYRSFRHNYSGDYGGKVHQNFDETLLFSALGIAPDWEKIRYYLLLDELF